MKQEFTKKKQTERQEIAQRKAKSLPAERKDEHPLLQLHQTIGNHGVLRRYPTVIQPKLKVSSANDKYEREADRVADMVVGTTNHANLQRVDDMRKGLVLRRAIFPPSVDSSGILETVKAVISSGGGKQLDNSTREFMELGFGGYDFSPVRIHTDHQATKSAQDLFARAYTVAPHIIFGPDEYQPHTQIGRRLIAHELEHVVQQTEGHSAANIQADPVSLAGLGAAGSVASLVSLGAMFVKTGIQADQVPLQLEATLPMSLGMAFSERDVEVIVLRGKTLWGPPMFVHMRPTIEYDQREGYDLAINMGFLVDETYIPWNWEVTIKNKGIKAQRPKEIPVKGPHRMVKIRETVLEFEVEVNEAGPGHWKQEFVVVMNPWCYVLPFAGWDNPLAGEGGPITVSWKMRWPVL